MGKFLSAKSCCGQMGCRTANLSILSLHPGVVVVGPVSSCDNLVWERKQQRLQVGYLHRATGNFASP